MRAITIIALGCLVLSGTSGALIASEPLTLAAPRGPQVDAEALALAREIVANGFPQEKRLQMMSGAMNAMMSQAMAAQDSGNRSPEVQVIIDRHLSKIRDAILVVAEQHIPELFDSFAYGYAREFSVEELRSIRDFSATPAGQRFIMRGSAILSDPDVAAANQSYMKEALALIPQFKETLTKELEAYFKKHPQAAGK
jgi:hypothetical protein